jgi:hypothetical protein
MSDFLVTELDDRFEFGVAIVDDDVLNSNDGPCNNTGSCCGSNGGCTNKNCDATCCKS